MLFRSSAHKAVELGFADKIMFAENPESTNTEIQNKDVGIIFSRMSVTNSLLSKIPSCKAEKSTGTPIENLDKRLSLLKPFEK